MKRMLAALFFTTALSIASFSCKEQREEAKPAPMPPPAKEAAMGEDEARRLVSEIENLAAPAEKAMNEAMWAAWISGKDEDYKTYEELELAYRKVYADRARYAALKKAIASGAVKDPTLQRRLAVAANESIENQIDEKLLAAIVAKSSEVEKKFNTFRGVLRGKQVTMNDIKDVLRASKDRRLREEAWLAQKSVGPEIAAGLVDLMKLRNQAARQMGFADFYEMHLAAGELTKADVKRLFDELSVTTEAPFTAAKAEIDSLLAKLLKVKPENLMPWDYSDPYFQEAPDVLPKADTSGYFKKLDVRDFAAAFYDALGFDARDILARSSLYEQPGKNPHAFSVSMDRSGDVRILCNLKNDEYWAETILHELGHALYDKHVNQALPWSLRNASSQFLTEGIAEMFGRMTRKSAVLVKYAKAPQKDADTLGPVLEKSLRYGMLVFARWSEVMVNFEMEAYANPESDLNVLWWSLVEKHQRLRAPAGRNAPDWASKIHIATSPVYYHNYVMGEMFASQLLHALAGGDPNAVDFVGKPEYGAALREKVFGPGTSLMWKDLVKSATGEEFTSKYFAEQFAK